MTLPVCGKLSVLACKNADVYVLLCFRVDKILGVGGVRLKAKIHLGEKDGGEEA